MTESFSPFHTHRTEVRTARAAPPRTRRTAPRATPESVRLVTRVRTTPTMSAALRRRKSLSALSSPPVSSGAGGKKKTKKKKAGLSRSSSASSVVSTSSAGPAASSSPASSSPLSAAAATNKKKKKKPVSRRLAAARALTRADVAGLKANSKAPDALRRVLIAAASLLGVRPEPDERGREDYWRPAQAMVQSAGFLSCLEAASKKKAEPPLPGDLDRAAGLLTELNPRVVRSTSRSAEPLLRWVVAMLEHFGVEVEFDAGATAGQTEHRRVRRSTSFNVMAKTGGLPPNSREARRVERERRVKARARMRRLRMERKRKEAERSAAESAAAAAAGWAAAEAAAAEARSVRLQAAARAKPPPPAPRATSSPPPAPRSASTSSPSSAASSGGGGFSFFGGRAPPAASSASPSRSSAALFRAPERLDSFKELMGVEGGFDAMLEHLESEYNQETLLFWQAVEDFRGDVDAGHALAIYKSYVAAGSELEVNVSGQLRKTVEAMVPAWEAADPDEAVDPGAFDAVQSEVASLLQRDCLPRFKKRHGIS